MTAVYPWNFLKDGYNRYTKANPPFGGMVISCRLLVKRKPFCNNLPKFEVLPKKVNCCAKTSSLKTDNRKGGVATRTENY